MGHMRSSRQPCLVAASVGTVLLTLLLACTVFRAGTASAFAIFPKFTVGGEVHQEITREALQQVVLTSHGDLKFLDAAIEHVVEANVFVDQFQDRPEWHFDNNQLKAGSEWIIKLKQEIIAALNRPTPLTLEEAYWVRRKLGRALHTLQDFYSHSNWVENNPEIINPVLGNSLLQEDEGTLVHPHCDIVTQSRLLTNHLVSEYAIWLEPTGVSLDLALAPAYECGHGLVTTGIHKDWAERPYFEDARRLAVEASFEFVQSQILSQATNVQSVCALLRGRYNCAGSPPSISINDVTRNRSDGVMTFTVTLSASSTSTVTVDFITVSGTAVPNSDYIPTSGRLTFNPGDTTQTISVTIIDNGIFQPDPHSRFSVVLTSASGATLADGVGIGTIVNYDIPPFPV